MFHARRFVGWAALVLLAVGCEAQRPATPPTAPAGVGQVSDEPVTVSASIGISAGPSDAEQVRAADYSILFVGNSHTMMHDIPGLVGKMIQFRFPEKKVCTHVIVVDFLEALARDRRAYDEIESKPWKFVVLQAQKISMSGRFNYSQTEGIDFAKAAKAKGADVFFFSEWGRKDVAGDGAAQEKIYQQMADAASVRVAAIGRAWDLVLADRPDTPLHNADGNHQSPVGAFLTACVLFGKLTGESPAILSSFPYRDIDGNVREFLAIAAAKAIAPR